MPHEHDLLITTSSDGLTDYGVEDFFDVGHYSWLVEHLLDRPEYAWLSRAVHRMFSSIDKIEGALESGAFYRDLSFR